MKPPLTYESCLRVVGRRLDSDSPGDFSMVEDPEGFQMAYVRSGQPQVTVTVRFDWNQLDDLATFHTGGRGGRTRRKIVDSEVPTGHLEDVLRAIGHHLDSRVAAGVRVTCVDASIEVTWISAEEAADSKGYWLLDRNEVDVLLRDARKRRRHLRLVQ